MNGLLSCASPWQNDSQNSISRKRTPSLATIPRNKTIKNNKIKSNQAFDLEDTNAIENEEETIFDVNKTEGFAQNTLETVQQDNQNRMSKVQNLINSMNTENDGQNLANFKPLDSSNSNSNFPETSASYEKYIPVKPLYSQPTTMSNPYSSYREIYNGDTTYNPGNKNLNNKHSTSTYESFLMEKLNRMLYILEEQQYEPTKHITEEFILYTFLGVFVIYVVDSFSRAGKYIR